MTPLTELRAGRLMSAGRRREINSLEGERMRLWMLLAVMCLAAAPAHAQDVDADGSKDHPMFSRMPGYYIQDYDAQDFSTFELDIDPPKTVEGRYTKISYWMKEGAKKAGPV